MQPSNYANMYTKSFKPGSVGSLSLTRVRESEPNKVEDKAVKKFKEKFGVYITQKQDFIPDMDFPGNVEYHALVITCSKYTKKEELPFVENDKKEMTEFLGRKLTTFENQNITYSHNENR